MRTGLSCLLLIVILNSCAGDKEQAPAEVLPPARMQELLWEMIRADVFVRDHLTADSARQPKSFGLYREILERHGTTREKFQESFAYYRGHPDLFRPILDSLEKKQQRLIIRLPADTGDRARPRLPE